MSARGDAAASLVNRLSLQSDTLSPDGVLEAFKPTSGIRERATLVLQLSQTKQDLPLLLSAKLEACLGPHQGDDGGHDSDLFAAVRLMTALFSVSPDAAHTLVLQSGLLANVLSASAAAAKKDYMLALVTSELLCAAANQAMSRRWMLSSWKGAEKTAEKIVEINESSEGITAMHWLMSFVEKANVENASRGGMLSKVALLSSLALHKIQRGSKGKENEDVADVAAGQSSEEGEEEMARREEEDSLLFELCKGHLIHDETEPPLYVADEQGKWQMESSTRTELERVCRLSSLEGLTYLTLDSTFKDALPDSKELLAQLCRMGSRHSGDGEEQSKSLFPKRNEAGGSKVTSSYELDKALASPHRDDQSGPDSALEYGIASLLANVMAYPPLLSAEEKQMERLRRMANAKAKVKGATDGGEEGSDERMSTSAIEARINKVLAAGGAEALSTIAIDSSGRAGSAAIRETVSSALLAMTTQQAKMQRGKIIQQGGAKALLTLSNRSLSEALRGEREQIGAARPSFAAIQALAHLLITENPSLVLREPAESIPSLVFLYIHSASSRLQRFEAALALTNLASLGQLTTKGIVTCAFPRNSVELHSQGDFAGVGARENKGAKVQIAEVLHERVFLEDNEMSRRASLELLCNLLLDEGVFKRWSGEEEDEEREKAEKTSASDDMGEGRAMKNIIFLVALCAPLGSDQASSSEGGLKLRLAASGALATLCSSPSACGRLLAVESRVLNKVSRLIRPASHEEDQEEANLHEQDISEGALGGKHASMQLALRGLTCLDCLVQYVGWLQGQGSRDVTVYKHKLVEAGCIEAIKLLALSLAKQIKVAQPNPTLQSLQEQLAHQSFDSLRACKAIGLV